MESRIGVSGGWLVDPFFANSCVDIGMFYWYNFICLDCSDRKVFHFHSSSFRGNGVRNERHSQVPLLLQPREFSSFVDYLSNRAVCLGWSSPAGDVWYDDRISIARFGPPPRPNDAINREVLPRKFPPHDRNERRSGRRPPAPSSRGSADRARRGRPGGGAPGWGDCPARTWTSTCTPAVSRLERRMRPFIITIVLTKTITLSPHSPNDDRKRTISRQIISSYIRTVTG